jgi:hypothetical protein
MRPTVLVDIEPAASPPPTRPERLAFCINTYNTLVARGIAAFGLRRSVWEVPDFFGQIAVRVDGLVFSADDIEHGVLRGNRPHPLSDAVPFAADDPRRRHAIEPPDPRIHFAVSCGACSCPPVHRYEAQGLDAQLEAVTREFVARDVRLEAGVPILSQIFEWFAEDFSDAGGVAAFLVRHLPEGSVRDALRRGGLAGAHFRPYDWRLAPMPPAFL